MSKSEIEALKLRSELLQAKTEAAKKEKAEFIKNAGFPKTVKGHKHRGNMF